LLDRASTLDGSRDHAADSFKRLPGGQFAYNAQRADGTDAHAQRRDGEAARGVDLDFATRGSVAQVFKRNLLSLGIGAVSMLARGNIDGGVLDAEGLGDIAGNGLEQFQHVVSNHELLAEDVQALDIMTTAICFLGLASRPGRWIAGDHRGKEKRE